MAKFCQSGEISPSLVTLRGRPNILNKVMILVMLRILFHTSPTLTCLLIVSQLWRRLWSVQSQTCPKVWVPIFDETWDKSWFENGKFEFIIIFSTQNRRKPWSIHGLFFFIFALTSTFNVSRLFCKICWCLDLTRPPGIRMTNVVYELHWYNEWILSCGAYKRPSFF